jgi:membrane-associated phospholipid phosphatase
MDAGAKPAAAYRATMRLQWLRANISAYLALFARRRRFAATPRWRKPLRLGIGAVLMLALVIAMMITIDARVIAEAQQLPVRLIESFDQITDFGKSVWVLVPIALLLASIAALASPALTRMSQRVLAALAARLGFLFLAIGLPGLCFTILKRLIGRARPLVERSTDTLIFRPLGWDVEYASLPSGHAIDAFAIAAALGALWPRARPVLWAYAITIAVSRVVLTAHFPSDVVAGAAAGAVGALLVRDWFAARGIAFTVGTDGLVRPLPGPSFVRMKRVARQLIAP